ncbi:type III-A CRISPR-associated RAMP protein Csm5 [Campylobacterota bacterium]|nr:type III-A CRISPR-associated RAMP protein Csm5 [Campylobacterota bacterium]
MKTYKLKLKALSPIHIGTGETYEPTNFIIDKLDNADYLFEFNEIDFYKALDNSKRGEFNSIVINPNANARFKLYGFIYANRQIAKQVSFRHTMVAPTLAQDYRRKIGSVVQKEGGGRSVFNGFFVERTYISPNTKSAVLLGSSLKGSISTAYQEWIYKRTKNYDNVKRQMLLPNDDNLFKSLLISDAVSMQSKTIINYAHNIKRNRETKANLPIMIESIMPTSVFTASCTCKEPLKFDEIAASCNDHYLPIFKTLFDAATDAYTIKSLSAQFAQHRNLQLAKNQFLLRVGKHSQARSVTVDGIRDIKIMQGRSRPPKFGKEETTVWITMGYPFGWLLCEIID